MENSNFIYTSNYLRNNIIQDSKKIKHTKVIKCEMSIFQYNTYNKTLKNDIKLKIGGLLTGASQSGNIVFPTSDSDTDGEYGKNGYGSVPEHYAKYAISSYSLFA